MKIEAIRELAPVKEVVITMNSKEATDLRLFLGRFVGSSAYRGLFGFHEACSIHDTLLGKGL